MPAWKWKKVHRAPQLAHRRPHAAILSERLTFSRSVSLYADVYLFLMFDENLGTTPLDAFRRHPQASDLL